MFTDAFVIGRDDACDVQVDSSLASRRHAEVLFTAGAWWIRDLDSTNGTYIKGQKIDEHRLEGHLTLLLGRDGPALELSVEGHALHARSAREEPATIRSQETVNELKVPPARPLQPDRSSTPKYREYTIGEHGNQNQSTPRPPENASSLPLPPEHGSVDEYIGHYFVDDGRPAGEHTRLIRRAYVEMNKKQRRKYGWVISTVAVVALSLAIVAGYQQVAMQRQERAAATLFLEMKEQALATARFKAVVESTGDAALEEQMAELERRRRRMAAQYDGYVKELGIYRKLSDEEQVIYDVARIFNESEFQMPAGFVREVRAMINDYWLGVGRGRFIQAIRRAEEMRYTPVIVETLKHYGLPPEFFYLALQESNFELNAAGPRTRWGIAKGMWQFIPDTGRRFGLSIGPREDMRVFDPQDERHDLDRSTEAAAKYLLEIYSTLAQASGLLVIASYNWGEHRVVNKLESLPGPQAIPVEALEGIPEDPSERNYWRFLGEYSDRMPDETKDYVLKIFAAAVIGQNPRLFGFDFDNVLQPYMEAPA